MNGKQVSRVIAAVARGAADPVLKSLREAGISTGHLAAGRSVALEDKKGFLGLGERSVIVEDPIEIFSFLVSPELEDTALDIIIRTGRLDILGRGSVHSETVHLIKSHALCAENSGAAAPDKELPLLTELMGICCIVQRGQGDAVARMALDTGTCVPAITFGTGTGVRDKLGLLRITIPADKEVISLAASVHDADAVMDLMIDAGKLDEPGKGFIYQYPLKQGIVNTKISRGMPKHAASIEQIISTIDQIKGNTQWRSRSGMASTNGGARRKYLTNLIDLTLICNEGRADDLVKSAMAAGAAGATISILKHVRPQDSGAAKVSPARESCNMIVGEQQIPAILAELDKVGAFDDKTHGLLYGKPAPKACTYLGK
jgi:hypothetical protein